MGYVDHKLDYRFLRGNEVRYWTLEYLRSGRVLLGTETGNDIFQAGSVALVPPHTSYSLDWAEGVGKWDEFYAFFEPAPHWNHLLSWPRKAHGLGVLDISDSTIIEDVEYTLRNALQLLRSARAQKQLLAVNALEKVLLTLDEINPTRGYALRDARIDEALSFIAQHYEQPLNLPNLAQQIFLSPSRFAHLFKAQMNLSPMQYVEYFRLERAAERLLIGQDSIEHIASVCGFPNAFHFSTRFRKHFGQSPSGYRRNPS